MDNQTPAAGPSKKTWYIIGAVVIVLFIASCVSKTMGGFMGTKMMEKAIEDASGGKADVDLNSDGTMNVKTSEGSITTGKSVPAGWPEDVAIYPDAII
jgi:hypothetical protein